MAKEAGYTAKLHTVQVKLEDSPTATSQLQSTQVKSDRSLSRTDRAANTTNCFRIEDQPCEVVNTRSSIFWKNNSFRLEARTKNEPRLAVPIVTVGDES